MTEEELRSLSPQNLKILSHCARNGLVTINVPVHMDGDRLVPERHKLVSAMSLLVDEFKLLEFDSEDTEKHRMRWRLTNRGAEACIQLLRMGLMAGGTLQ
jgi:hypothetical protein